MRETARSGSVDRITAADLLQLRTDVGPVPMHIAAVLTLGGDVRVGDMEEVLRTRLAAVPRLGQVLVTPPPGLGRPYWRDDPGFDVRAHVTTLPCPVPGDIDSVLDVATGVVTTRLPSDRPQWRAVVVRRADEDVVEAVVIVLHHVLADGLGGLAVLAQLSDDGFRPVRRTATESVAGSHAANSSRALLSDRAATLARGLRSARGTLRPALARTRRGWDELGHGRPQSAPRTSLNRPTGARRVCRVVAVGLEPVRAAARREGVTVNDILLVAATGAMAEVLRRRGEVATDLVVSVPVSSRGGPDGRLGNHVGVMPVRVPLDGARRVRLREVARRTRARKTQVRGDSASLLGPAFRVLAATGTFHWFIDRQRLVNSFLTNVRGPSRTESLCGSTIEHVVPMATTPGNVGVSFAALSYAGELAVTVIADPDVVPEVVALANALDSEIRLLVADHRTYAPAT